MVQQTIIYFPDREVPYGAVIACSRKSTKQDWRSPRKHVERRSFSEIDDWHDHYVGTNYKAEKFELLMFVNIRQSHLMCISRLQLKIIT